MSYIGLVLSRYVATALVSSSPPCHLPLDFLAMGQVSPCPAPGVPRFIAVPGPMPPGEPKPWPTYDYIIVGGGSSKGDTLVSKQRLTRLFIGTAGCVLAARLSEDPKTTVLLIEAGRKCVCHDYMRFLLSVTYSSFQGVTATQIPLSFSDTFRSDLDWNTHTMYVCALDIIALAPLIFKTARRAV